MGISPDDKPKVVICLIFVGLLVIFGICRNLCGVNDKPTPEPEAAPPPQVQPYRRIPAQPNTTYVIDMPQTMLNPERPRSSSQVCIAVTPSAPQLPECVPRPPVSIPRPTVAPAPRPPVPEPSNVRQSTSTSQITVNPIVDPNMDPPSYDEVMGNANAYEMQSPYNPSYRT